MQFYRRNICGRDKAAAFYTSIAVWPMSNRVAVYEGVRDICVELLKMDFSGDG